MSGPTLIPTNSFLPPDPPAEIRRRTILPLRPREPGAVHLTLYMSPELTAFAAVGVLCATVMTWWLGLGALMVFALT